jgi:hypothetical protein
MALHNPKVAGVRVKELIEPRFIRKLDESGFIGKVSAEEPKERNFTTQLDPAFIVKERETCLFRRISGKDDLPGCFGQEYIFSRGRWIVGPTISGGLARVTVKIPS